MARLEDIPQPTRDAVLAVPCPSFDTQPFVVGPPLAQRRVAIVSSAALIQRGDKPFPFGSAECRFLPASVPTGDILISHVSINFDRTGFQRDLNVPRHWLGGAYKTRCPNRPRWNCARCRPVIRRLGSIRLRLRLSFGRSALHRGLVHGRLLDRDDTRPGRPDSAVAMVRKQQARWSPYHSHHSTSGIPTCRLPQ
jgi:hypothetical protein